MTSIMQSIISIFMALGLVFSGPTELLKPHVTQVAKEPAPTVIASQVYSLDDRYHNQFVNDVFADNILLTLSYMDGEVKKGQPIDWDKVHTPGKTQFLLKPGDTFAFHDQVEKEYQSSVVQTTNAHFNSTEGFKSDGYLFGDGVCHLASFMNVVATMAGLKVDAPVRHDFAAIPDVPREFGTSIFFTPNGGSVTTRQNLYITNTTDKPIAFVFEHTQDSVKITVESI